MDYNITFDNFFFKILYLFLIHCLNLVITLKIRFLEMFEFTLKLLELPSCAFELTSKQLVLILEGLVGTLVVVA
jgi:hypothetical protein